MLILYLFLLFAVFYVVHCRYILHTLDTLAHIVAHIVLKFGSVRRKMEKNIKFIFPHFTDARVNDIIFKSMKLNILNILIALHQPFVLDNPHWIKYATPYPEVSQEYLNDLQTTKCVNIVSHLGIFYDVSALHNSYGSKTAVVYRPVSKAHTLLFACKAFRGKIFGMTNTVFVDYLKDLKRVKGSTQEQLSDTSKEINNYPIILIPCDSHSRNKTTVEFLGKRVSFHSSPVDVHKLTGRPIWFVYAIYDFQTRKIIYNVTSVYRECDDVSDEIILQKVANCISEIIVANPEQYCWSLNRFYTVMN